MSELFRTFNDVGPRQGRSDWVGRSDTTKLRPTVASLGLGRSCRLAGTCCREDEWLAIRIFPWLLAVLASSGHVVANETASTIAVSLRTFPVRTPDPLLIFPRGRQTSTAIFVVVVVTVVAVAPHQCQLPEGGGSLGWPARDRCRTCELPKQE